MGKKGYSMDADFDIISPYFLHKFKMSERAVSQNEAKLKVQTKRAWLIWGFSALFFFADYLARVAPSVMGLELQAALGIGATGFGVLTACFYWTYIPMQLPVGLLVDRYSMRWLLTSMALLVAFSCLLFASSYHVSLACVSRLLLGFGAAFALVSALKLASIWFDASRLGLLAGCTQALGMLGAASGELPVTYMLDQFGWRMTMVLMASGFALLALAFSIVIRDKSTVANLGNNGFGVSRGIMSSLRVVLANPQTWLNACYAGLLFLPSAVLGESWGPEYLKHVHHLERHEAAFANSMIFVGWGIGGPMLGSLSDYFRRRKIFMLISALSSFVCISYLIWGPVMNWKQISRLLFLYGLSNTGIGVAYALSTEINASEDNGISIAFANMGSIVIGALFLPVMGVLIDWHHGTASLPYYAEDFQFAMNCLPFSLIAALCVGFFLKETHCRSKQN